MTNEVAAAVPADWPQGFRLPAELPPWTATAEDRREPSP